MAEDGIDQPNIVRPPLSPDVLTPVLCGIICVSTKYVQSVSPHRETSDALFGSPEHRQIYAPSEVEITSKLGR